MKLDAYLYTNPGGRPENEDSAGYRLKADSGIFVLSDGLGGHQGGAIASDLVVQSLFGRWDSREPVEDSAALELWLQDGIQEANQALLAAQEQNKSSMKSTVVALALEREHCAWAHVGDSRLYYLTGGRLMRATQDHSVTYKKFLAGEITREEINFDDDRSSLLRVVGDPARCLPDVGGPVDGLARTGEAFLLCSDGFWEYLYDEEVLIDFLKAESPERWAELMLLRVLPRISQDTDNLTLLTVFVE